MNDSNTDNMRATSDEPWSARSRHYAAVCLAAVVACTGALACSDEDDDQVDIAALNPSNDGEPGATTSPGGGSDRGAAAAAALASAAQQLDDAQIVYVADTLNAGKVEQANTALPRLNNEDVRTFAQRMADEHSAARDQLSQLAAQQGLAPGASGLADTLHLQNETAVKRLARTRNLSVDLEYIRSQVAAQQLALVVVDALSAAADSEALRAQLTTLSGQVAEHRATAVELAESLHDE